MRKLIGVAFFFVTLMLGVAANAVVSFFDSSPEPVAVEIALEDEAQVTRSPDGIRIAYLGLDPEAFSGTGMRFLIYNGSNERVTCIGYNGVCASPQIQIGGKDAKAWVCLNGNETYTIEPGMTAELRVGSYDFEKLPATNETVEIGYEFTYSDGREEKYFAEPMLLPKKFRDEISRAIRENAR